jgi:tetratricopeptide (TPR) repeat protein
VLFELRSAGMKWCAGATFLVLAALFLHQAAQPWRADRLARGGTRAALKAAAAFEPGNAERQYALGNYLFTMDADFAAAEQAFRSAVAIQPRTARSWMALATVAQFMNDAQAESVALREAVRLNPSNPETALAAAVMFLGRGDVEEALKQYRNALTYNPDLAASVYMQVWRRTHRADQLMTALLLPDARCHAALLAQFVREDQPESAAQVWDRWLKLPGDMAADASFTYLDYLLKRRDPPAAKRVWRDAARRSIELHARTETGNLVSNGGFEWPILNGGLEWRYAPNPLASLQTDAMQFHRGNSSLRATFSGATGTDTGIAQYVILDGNTAYRLHAWMRTDEIDSAHGPRFAVDDAATGVPLATTAEALGSSPWTEYTATIAPDPAPRIVVLRVVRDAATHIRGRAWIDDVSITAISPQS